MVFFNCWTVTVSYCDVTLNALVRGLKHCLQEVKWILLQCEKPRHLVNKALWMLEINCMRMENANLKFFNGEHFRRFEMLKNNWIKWENIESAQKSGRSKGEKKKKHSKHSDLSFDIFHASFHSAGTYVFCSDSRRKITSNSQNSLNFRS